ncbi:phosphoribosylaminoimidazole-succinocarboxamide synthase [Thiohalorhabdus denitrificans]|uniref:Phosphoribosylaminoimidazole-succinocarboxamide synthase n=1 Tax=Thiohalorhabdus denitrificans TaxID=381306 RepID=A0A0N8PMM4_9GAMM|nr:phosphoribosylaminoimidazolesuccinocarboxamide synthase [Thiohalorhabdus denitrificans]KPV39133.1 phosphoribosylaminoimidazole-succinocarboxamide synthase [Thiohalorhabdus denitrificans]SCX76754.1 phosphoribosylaminoimidazole-succinocarboxamide synthase [Thiohalorhabdus denitrificans]
MEKGDLLYEGKGKRVYRTEDPEALILEFKDTATAFDGKKREELDEKGRINNRINAFLMDELAAAGIPVHHRRVVSDTESEVKALDMLPVEAVVRNVVAGSLARRLGLEEGTELDRPVFEFFYKSDELGDPMINQFHILAFGWASREEVDRMIELSFRVNDVLVPLFEAGGMRLVDYKLEFGRFRGGLVVGDELTPDGCRLWDLSTGEKLDKDRFRRDLGDVLEGYREIGRRLGVDL